MVLHIQATGCSSLKLVLLRRVGLSKPKASSTSNRIYSLLHSFISYLFECLLCSRPWGYKNEYHPVLEHLASHDPFPKPHSNQSSNVRQWGEPQQMCYLLPAEVRATSFHLVHIIKNPSVHHKDLQSRTHPPQ